MPDFIRQTPYVNPLTGYASEIIGGLLGYMKDPRRTQQLQGIASLLESTGIPKTVERLAYGEPLTNIQQANVPALRPETAEALMTLLPIPSGANKAAMAAGRAGERMAERVVPQIMERGGMPAGLLGAMSNRTISPLDVWHGTPHTLPPTLKNPLGEFDASKIGTGEGAQAFGYGTYVAENPAVAKEYTFMENNWFDTSKATYKGKPIDYWYEKAQKDQDIAFRTKNKALEKDANARLAYWEKVMTHTHPEKVVSDMTSPDFGWDEATKYAKSIDLTKFSGIPNPGNLYKVDLPDEKIAKMLDWDLPLSKQSPQVQAAIEKLTGLKVDKSKMAEFDDALLGALQGGSMELPKQPLDPIGADLYAKFISGGNENAAKKLQELGITGVKYLDQFSRDINKNYVVNIKDFGGYDFPSMEEAITFMKNNPQYEMSLIEPKKTTSNFVLFPTEEKSLTILERNGMPADQAALLSEQKRKELLGLLD